jgi:hypothetical protein
VIPGAYEAAVMRKMRDLRFDRKYTLDHIADRCLAFADFHHNYNAEQQQELLISLAAQIGNYLEER